MDRFIDLEYSANQNWICCLKSNMDRFIGILKKVTQSLKRCLKSNMDRFIVRLLIHARK